MAGDADGRISLHAARGQQWQLLYRARALRRQLRRRSDQKKHQQLQLAPEFNIALPNHWFFTFYPNPDIRINYGDAITGQTGRLFLPLDVMLGRNRTKNIVASIEVSVPDHQGLPGL